MEQTFGERLQAARKRTGFSTQAALGDVVDVSGKTIRNYETGKTTPDALMLEKLRKVLGEFDAEGDPVETAIRQSRLVGFRQTKVLGVYEEQLYEQDREERGAG